MKRPAQKSKRKKHPGTATENSMALAKSRPEQEWVDYQSKSAKES